MPLNPPTNREPEPEVGEQPETAEEKLARELDALAGRRAAAWFARMRHGLRNPPRVEAGTYDPLGRQPDSPW